jgi:Tol biopolymer transport system component
VADSGIEVGDGPARGVRLHVEPGDFARRRASGGPRSHDASDGAGRVRAPPFLGQVTLDGSVQTRLLGWPVEEPLGGATFSPDGKRIAFEVYGGGSNTRYSEATIYTMDADGTNVERLTSGFDPAFSADGHEIAFSRQEAATGSPPNFGIYSVGVGGEDEKRIGPGSDPDFSPDGEQIAFEGRAPADDPDFCDPSPTLSVMNSNGSGVRHLRTGFSCEDGAYESFGSPSFSPNGRKIIFALYNGGGGIRPFEYISVMNVDGSNEFSAWNSRYDFDPGLGEVDWGPRQADSDAARCGGLRATIVGTPLSDLITGTRRPDVVQAGGGDDSILGRHRADRICGSAGDDTARGGKGSDRLLGGRGRDACVGGAGRDRLIGCEPKG